MCLQPRNRWTPKDTPSSSNFTSTSCLFFKTCAARFLFSSLPPHLLLLYALMLRLFVPSPPASCKCFSQPLEDTRVHKSNEHATPLLCLSYGYSRVAFGWTNANVSVSHAHTQHEHYSGGCLVDSVEFRAQMVADKGKFVCYRPYARVSRMSFN